MEQNLQPKPGDIVGFSGACFVSDLVNLATLGIPRFGISHVGIMATATDGRLLLFESTTLEGLPDAITGEKFDGTQAHTLESELEIYKGKIWLYPLYRELYDAEQTRLTKFLMSTLGTQYDKLGAFRSGGVGFSWLESMLHEQNLHSIFCSEWIMAAYSKLGIHPTNNASRWNPNRAIHNLRRDEILLKPTRLK